MKRMKYQKLIAEAMTTTKIVDFVDAHPELMPEWSQNIWEVAHYSSKEIRAATGLTQTTFAESIGIGRRTVADWEANNGKECRLAMRLALAEMAGLVKVPLEW